MRDPVAIQTEIISEESSKSAVSWGAILAGGVASAAFTLFLVELVAGLGLVMVRSLVQFRSERLDAQRRRRHRARPDGRDGLRARWLYRQSAAHSLGRNSHR